MRSIVSSPVGSLIENALNRMYQAVSGGQMIRDLATIGRVASLIILLTVTELTLAAWPARADIGPKPSMDFEFVYETRERLTIVDGEQMQCEQPDCVDAEPLEELGPQGLHCTDEACSSTSYGYATYNQLVIQFSDGVTRVSDVFSSGTMRTDYRVTVRQDSLEIERVKRGRGRLPFVWTLVGRLLGTAVVIPLGLLLLVGVLLFVLDAWGRE